MAAYSFLEHLALYSFSIVISINLIKLDLALVEVVAQVSFKNHGLVLDKSLLSQSTGLNGIIKVLLYFLIEACSYLFSNDGGDKADFYCPKFYPFAFPYQDMEGLD